MMVLESRTRITADEFFQMPGLERAELVNGAVVELPPLTWQEGFLCAELGSSLQMFVKPRRLGRVLARTCYKLKSNPDLVRSPDVSFLEAQRLPAARALPGYIAGPPTLAVEIVSPGDLWSEVEDKVNEYLEAGARAVWIVEPTKQTATVRTAESAPKVLHRHETLSGDEMLPGFELALAELFNDEP